MHNKEHNKLLEHFEEELLLKYSDTINDRSLNVSKYSCRTRWSTDCLGAKKLRSFSVRVYQVSYWVYYVRLVDVDKFVCISCLFFLLVEAKLIYSLHILCATVAAINQLPIFPFWISFQKQNRSETELKRVSSVLSEVKACVVVVVCCRNHDYVCPLWHVYDDNRSNVN